MRKYLIFAAAATILSSCAETPKETYPYGMTAKEWNELSVKDKANIRRDFYFYEKGSINFVNPQLEVEGRKDANIFTKQKRPSKPVQETLAEPEGE